MGSISNPLRATPTITIVTVTTDPTPLPAIPLKDRTKIKIINPTTVDLLITDAEGTADFPIPPDIPIEYNAPENVIIYARVLSGSVNIPVQELK
jgi:hypothetical protein